MTSEFVNKDKILKEFQAILALEEEAAKAYQQLAQDCDDPIARALLQEIAKEEAAHVTFARKLVEIASKQMASRVNSLVKLNAKSSLELKF